MVDPLGLSVLAGAALTQGFGFLYKQLESLLERRRAQREGQLEQYEAAETLSGEVRPAEVDDQVLAQHAAELERLHRVLAPYVDARNTDGRDAQVRQELMRLCEILKAVHGEPFTGSTTENSAAHAESKQRSESVHGEVIGVEDKKGGRSISSDQDFKVIHEGSSVIGIRLE